MAIKDRYKKKHDECLMIDGKKHFIHLETDIYFIVSKYKESKRKFTILKIELEKDV